MRTNLPREQGDWDPPFRASNVDLGCFGLVINIKKWPHRFAFLYSFKTVSAFRQPSERYVLYLQRHIGRPDAENFRSAANLAANRHFGSPLEVIS